MQESTYAFLFTLSMCHSFPTSFRSFADNHLGFAICLMRLIRWSYQFFSPRLRSLSSPCIAGALSNDYFKGIDFDSVFLRRYKKGTSMDIKPLLECLKVVQSLPKRFLLKDLLDELCRSFKNVHLW